MKKCALLLMMTLLLCSSSPVRRHAERLMDRITVMETHCDFPEVFYYDPNSGYNLVTEDAKGQVSVAKMRKGHMNADYLAYYLRPSPDQTDSAACEIAPQQLWDMMNVIEPYVRALDSYCGIARTAKDAETLRKQGKIAFFFGLENAFFVGNDLKNLEILRDRNITYITLSHWGDNQFCHSSDRGKDPSKGLTEKGRELVAEMNRLGIVIDLSHTSYGTWKDVLELSKAPVAFTHSGAAGVYKHQRNVDDETLRALARNGGVIQVYMVNNFMADKEHYDDVGVKEMVDHICHIVKVAGIDHVGIGVDFDGGGGGVGIRSAADAVNITVELINRGFSDEDITKIWGGNWLRVLTEVQALAEK